MSQQPPTEAIQLVCDALTAIVAHSGDPAGTVNTLAPWRTRAETFIQNYGKPLEGQWVAFVDATDGRHLKAQPPAPATPTQEAGARLATEGGEQCAAPDK